MNRKVPFPVRVQLNWAHVVDWGAFYIADADGDYAGQGLALTLLVGRDDAQGRYIDPLTAVLEGRADFGITTGSDLLQARARGAPLVAVAHAAAHAAVEPAAGLALAAAAQGA